jgi:hypothetical protein
MASDATVKAFVSTGSGRGFYQDVAVRVGAAGLVTPQGNDIAEYLADGLWIHGDLGVQSTPEDFETQQIAVYSIGGVMYTKAAAVVTSFSAAHVVTAELFGTILIQVDAAGTISTLITGATQTTAMAYATAALAIAALPAPAAGNIALGYFVIEADAGDWTANTDSMTDDLEAITIVNADEKTLPSEV